MVTPCCPSLAASQSEASASKLASELPWMRNHDSLVSKSISLSEQHVQNSASLLFSQADNGRCLSNVLFAVIPFFLWIRKSVSVTQLIFKATQWESVIGNVPARENVVAHNVQRKIWNVGCASTPSQLRVVWRCWACSNQTGAPSNPPTARFTFLTWQWRRTSAATRFAPRRLHQDAAILSVAT